MIYPLSPFSYTEKSHGTPSVDPFGRADSRLSKGTPPSFTATLEVSFEPEDVGRLNEALILLGYLPIK